MAEKLLTGRMVDYTSVLTAAVPLTVAAMRKTMVVGEKFCVAM